MSDINTISPEVKLIRIIGTRIVELDEQRSALSRESTDRKKLDNYRDLLDAYQRSLVRDVTISNTANFEQHITDLKQSNKKLKDMIKNMSNIADTLDNLVKFVEVVSKLVSLIPK